MGSLRVLANHKRDAWREAEARVKEMQPDSLDRGAEDGLHALDTEQEYEAWVRSRVSALAELPYGPPLGDPGQLKTRADELGERLKPYSARIDQYRGNSHQARPGGADPPAPAVPPVVSVVLVLVLLAMALVVLGVRLSWALGGMLALAAALCALNLQAAPAVVRSWATVSRGYVSYRRDCRMVRRMGRESRRLESLRAKEIARRAAAGHWTEQQVAWLMAEYRIARQLGQRARLTGGQG